MDRSPPPPPARYRDGSEQDGAGYSRAVRRGCSVEVSGTTCPDPAAFPDVFSQTLECLRRAVAALEAVGGSIEDVVRTRVYLVAGSDWEAAAAAHERVLGAVSPANTMLYVAGLIGEGVLVEVEVSARCPPAGEAR